MKKLKDLNLAHSHSGLQLTCYLGEAGAAIRFGCTTPPAHFNTMALSYDEALKLHDWLSTYVALSQDTEYERREG